MHRSVRVILAIALFLLVFAEAKSSLLTSLLKGHGAPWFSEKFGELPKYLGSKTPYQNNKKGDYEAPPQGCKAVHIGGVHRHGSRFLAKDKGIQHVIDVLKSAKEKDELSERGIATLKWLYDVKAIFREGALTSQGEQELYEMGRRTYERFPEVFASNDRKILLSATYKERTQESRDRFQSGLIDAGQIDPALFEVHTHTRCADLSLRYFDSCQKYADYRSDLFKDISKEKISHLETKKQNIHSRDRSLEQIFKNYGQGGLSSKDAWKITDELFEFCQQDFDLDSKTGEGRFCSLLNGELKKIVGQKDNLSTYYKLGPIADVLNDTYSKVTCAMSCMAIEPLFAEIEKQVRGDSDASAAILGFAHAETVVPLADYFKLFDEKLSNWSASEVAQMGANFEIVTYECTTNEEKSYKLKLFYNEKEYHFPIPECRNSYFCDWPLVQKFYAGQKIAHGTNSCSLKDWNSYCGNPISDEATCTGTHFIEHEEDN